MIGVQQFSLGQVLIAAIIAVAVLFISYLILERSKWKRF